MVNLNKITIHWTAATYVPNAIDSLHYHFLIDNQGRVFKGNFKPEDNKDCSDGKYAAHCGGGNTGNIGIGLCGMYGFKNKNFSVNYPLTKIQLETCFQLCAELSKMYNIPITKENIFTHYEFGKKHPKTSSAGKIDIIYLPPYSDISQDNIGDFIRQKIYWYSQNLYNRKRIL